MTWSKNKRHRMILYDKATLAEEEGIEEEKVDDAFQEVKRSLQTGDTFFKIEDAGGGRPDSVYNVDRVLITEEDRGYLFLKRDNNGEYVDYGMMRLDYDRDEDVIDPGVVKVLEFEYDELADPTVTPPSRNQFYFDLLQEAGDRAPEELISRLSTDFTPDYDVPESSEWRYDD